MTEVKIRPADVQDAQGIATVHVKMWQHAYKGLIPADYLNDLSVEQRTEGWKKELQNPHKGSYAYVAEVDGQVRGWCTGGVNRDKDVGKEVAELYGIYVHPDFAGQGLGSKLMEQLLSILRQEGYQTVTLWVLDTNQKTRNWYESRGWRLEGATKLDDRGSVKLNEVRYIKDLQQ